MVNFGILIRGLKEIKYILLEDFGFVVVVGYIEKMLNN